MATVKVKLRRSKVPGKVVKLFIQIIHNREIKTVTTPLKLLPIEWNDMEQRIILDIKHVSRAIELCTIEKELNQMLNSIDFIITKLNRRKSYTVSEILELYNGCNSKSMLSRFMTRCVKEFKTKGKESTACKYKVTLVRFLDFRNGIDVSFNDITPCLLKQFEDYLTKRDVTMNTISFYMRIIRAVYNKAVREGLATEQNLFKDVYTGIAKTEKRAVDEKIIQRLKVISLPDKLAFARDMFMFSFYTRGMSFVDMSNLRKSDYMNGILSYRRSKTGQLLKIRIEPCISEIINRYAKYCRNDQNLLPITLFSGVEIRYSTAIRIHNNRLKMISEIMSIIPYLTSYVSRHTWASIARKKGINLSVISEGMGHTSEKTTQIYLASFDQNLLDEANKIVILDNKKGR